MRLFLHGRSQPSMLLDHLRQAHPEISVLLLSGWEEFSQENADVQHALLDFLDQHHDLEEIIVQNCTGRYLQTLMFGILQSSPRILTIRYDRQQDMPSAIACGLMQGTVTRTQRLNLRGMNLTSETAEALQMALPENFPVLTDLSIKGNLLLTDVDKGTSIFGTTEEESSSSESALRRIGTMFEGIPNLKCLELEYCHMEDRPLASLLEKALSCCLIEDLKLRGNQSKDQTIRVLSRQLKANQCSLKSLDMTWQRVRDSEGAFIRPRRKRIPSAPSLPTFDALPLLCKALAQNTSLQTLVLSENKLSEMSVEIISKSLEHNKTLKRLELKDCRLSQDSVYFLALSLPKMRLQSLQIDGIQKISPQEEERVLKSLFLVPLTKNVYLYELAMNCRSRTIEWLLEWNRAGRRATLEAPMPASLWPILLERADRICRNEQTEKTQATLHGATAIFNLLQESGVNQIIAA